MREVIEMAPEPAHKSAARAAVAHKAAPHKGATNGRPSVPARLRK